MILIRIGNEKYRNPQGKPWKVEASPPLPPQGAGYLPLRSLLSLGNGSIAIVPLPSFRWAMKSTNTQL
ncbi:MAG: hypothetical protein CVV52_15175 [Spirochaetae bacterium HGW-Spirochaetae-8]|nr:MAG: hypothetical protein CVV52_15175 [Spirochaetae bacterium HGW-Spirochaetae-8]